LVADICAKKMAMNYAWESGTGLNMMQEGVFSYGDFPWLPYSGATVGPRHNVTLNTQPGQALVTTGSGANTATVPLTTLPWLPYGRSIPLVYLPHDPGFTTCQFAPNANRAACDALYGSAWNVYDEPEFDI
jgi:hypothetical protein